MQLGGNRLFLPFSPELNQEVKLPEEEAHHLIKVLRKRQGDRILLVNGRGKEYEGEIKEVRKYRKRTEVKILICRIIREEDEPSPKVIVLMPLLKGDKKDFLIEKLTELGADVIFPFFSDFSESKVKKELMKRFQKKAISALKQCGRLYLPLIKPPEELVKILEEMQDKEGVFLWASERGGLLSQEVVKELYQCKEVVLVSGPEGGFSPREEELLKSKFFPIKLSPYILRAETASLSLTALIFHHLLAKK